MQQQTGEYMSYIIDQFCQFFWLVDFASNPFGNIDCMAPPHICMIFLVILG